MTVNFKTKYVFNHVVEKNCITKNKINGRVTEQLFTLYSTIVFLLDLGHIEMFFIQNHLPNITVHSYCDRAVEGPISLSCSQKRGAWGTAEISILEALMRG